MSKPCVLYPTGQGGHWLSNLIHSLETNQLDIVSTSNNFHKYTQSNEIYFSHENNPQGVVIGSFSSYKSQFITYLNAYYKCFSIMTDIQYLKGPDLLYELSNQARWRIDVHSSLFEHYLDKIVLNADLIFTDATAFAFQLFAVLNRHNIKYTPNLEFVLESVDNFKKSCWSLDNIDITTNIPWLAWCHAICILNNIDVPCSIRDNFDESCKWLVSEQQYFLRETNKHFITHI